MTLETREHLNRALKRDSRFKNVDDLIEYLLDEEWKRTAVEDWDRFWATPAARTYRSERDEITTASAGFSEPGYEENK